MEGKPLTKRVKEKEKEKKTVKEKKWMADRWEKPSKIKIKKKKWKADRWEKQSKIKKNINTVKNKEKKS